MGELGELVKIRVPLPDGPVAGERLWAIPVGGGLFEVRNVPFFVFGLAEGDVVRCVPHNDFLEMTDVVQHSGNTCLRVYFEAGAHSSTADEVVEHIERLGCTYERGKKIVAVTVPPVADSQYRQIVDYLNSAPGGVLWEVGYRPETTGN